MGMGDRYDYYPPNEPRRGGPPRDFGGGYEEPPGPPGPPGPIEPPPPQPSFSGPAPRPAPKPRRAGAIIGLRAGGMIVLLGVLIFFVGAILLQSVSLLEQPEWEDFEDDEKDYDEIEEDYDDAMEGYEDAARNLYGIGRILNWVGGMFIVLPLYMMGITNDNLDWKIRASMLSTSTAIVITVIVVTLFNGFPL
jgi:hypothetical protein